MTTTTQPRTCPITGHELGPDRYASPAAAGRLRATLVMLPDVMAELDIAISRQVRMGDSLSGAADDRLFFNEDAREKAWVLRTTLLVWADEFARLRNEPTPDTWSRIEEAFTGWSDWLTTIPQGAQAIDEILDAHHHALRAIDRPPERTYAGPCPTCTGDVYGRPGTPGVRCATCGTEFDLDEARQVMLDRLAVMHLPASQASRAVSLLTGQPLTAAQVRKMKQDRKVDVIVNEAGQPLYDVAEVARIVMERAERIGA